MTKFKSMMLTLAMATVVAGVGLWPVASQAALINGLFSVGLNTIQDQDAERVLRPNQAGGYDIITSGAFQTGDLIQSILRFDTVNAATISDTLSSPYQLTGYSVLKIDNIVDLGGGAVNLVFGPSGLLADNSMADLYERTSGAQPGYSSSVDPATGIANVTGQTFLAALGLNGIDDFWTSTAINNIGIIATATQGSGQSPSGVFGLSVLTNPGGLPIVTNGILSPIDGNLHDVVGDASIYARETGVNSGWLVSSNINASFTVPEPGTLALVGLALFGIGAVARRRMI
jgi:hypothetical protein